MKINQILQNRYQITKAIPSGPNNHLYIASDKRNDQSVIVKTFAQPELWDTIFKNRENLFSLNSAYIPRTLAVEVMDGKNCLIEEFIEGISLNAFLAGTTITYQHFFDIFGNLLDALDALHSRQLVHGDIKPQNIFVKQNNGKATAILIDIDSAFMHERRKTFYGTLSYAAPEQLIENIYLPKSDIYSLGLVACYMIEGKLPFDASKAGLHRRVAGSHAITLSGIHDVFVKRDLELLLSEMTDVDASNRPSISSVQKRLKNIYDKVASLHELDLVICSAEDDGNQNALFDTTQYVEFDTEGIQTLTHDGPISGENAPSTYRTKLMEEYDNLSKQAAVTFKLWVATFVLGLGIVVVTVAMICLGKYVEAMLSVVLESLVYFSQKLFAIREEYYRKQNDNKLKHLESGDSYEYLMSTLEETDDEYRKKKIDLIWEAIISAKKSDSDNPDA